MLRRMLTGSLLVGALVIVLFAFSAFTLAVLFAFERVVSAILSFTLLLAGLGIGVYNIAQKIEGTDKLGKAFFIVGYAISLAAPIVGVLTIAFADRLADVLEGLFISIVGLGSVVSVTGVLVAHKTIKKKREAQGLTHTPEN